MKKILMVAALLFLAVNAYAEEEGLKIGATVPNFMGRFHDESVFKLSAEGVNQPKVLNFFWDKCVPCQKELPELAVMEIKHPKIKFITIHSEGSPKADVDDFLATLSMHPKTVVYSNRKVMEVFQFQHFPHTIVVDAQNKVHAKISGYTDDNMKKLEKALKDLE